MAVAIETLAWIYAPGALLGIAYSMHHYFTKTASGRALWEVVDLSIARTFGVVFLLIGAFWVFLLGYVVFDWTFGIFAMLGL